MIKGRIAILIVLVVGLILILYFLSWTTPKVIQESPKANSNALTSSFFTNFSPFLAGIIIVGIITLWIIVVMDNCVD